MPTDLDWTIGLLTERRDEAVGDVDERNTRGDRIAASAVDDGVGAVQLIEDSGPALAVLGQHRLGFAGDEQPSESLLRRRVDSLPALAPQSMNPCVYGRTPCDARDSDRQVKRLGLPFGHPNP